MTSSIKTDNNFEIVFDELGVAESVSEKEDTAQSITTELNQNLGQYKLNELFGTNWMQEDGSGVIQNKKNIYEIKNEVTRVINKYDIESINDIIIEDGKNATIKAYIVIGGEDVVITV